MPEVAGLAIKIDSREVDGARKKLEKLGKTGKKTETATDRLKKSTQGLSKSFHALGAAITVAATAKLAVDVIRLADTYTLLNNKLKLVTTSEQNLSVVQKQLYQLTLETHGVYADTVSLYSRFARATEELGTSQDDLMVVTKALNEAILVSGASSNEANAAITQLGQGMASGVLRGDELNSVLEQTPRIARMIADGMGITIGQLREYGKQGKLTSEDVINAIKSQAGVVHQEFGKMAVTVGQAWGDVRTVFKGIIADGTRATDMTASLSGEISEFAGWLDSHRDDFQDFFLQGAEAVSTMLEELERLGTEAEPYIDALVTSVEALYGVTVKYSELSGMSGSDWGIIGGTLLAGGPQAAALVAALITINNQLEIYGLNIGSLAESSQGFGEAVNNIMAVLRGEKDWSTGESIVVTKTERINEAIKNLQIQIEETGDPIGNFFRRLVTGKEQSEEQARAISYLNDRIARLRSELEGTIHPMEDLGGVMGDYDWEGPAPAFERTANAVVDFCAALKKAKSCQEKFMEKSAKAGKALGKTDFFQGMSDAMRRSYQVEGQLQDKAIKDHENYLEKRKSQLEKFAEDGAKLGDDMWLAFDKGAAAAADRAAAEMCEFNTIVMNCSDKAFDKLGMMSENVYGQMQDNAKKAYDVIIKEGGDQVKAQEGYIAELESIDRQYNEGRRSDATTTFQYLDELNKNFVASVQTTLGDSLSMILKGEFDGIAGLWKNMLSSMLDMFADWLAKIIMELIAAEFGEAFGGIGSAISSALGFGDSGKISLVSGASAASAVAGGPSLGGLGSKALGAVGLGKAAVTYTGVGQALGSTGATVGGMIGLPQSGTITAIETAVAKGTTAGIATASTAAGVSGFGVGGGVAGSGYGIGTGAGSFATYGGGATSFAPTGLMAGGATFAAGLAAIPIMDMIGEFMSSGGSRMTEGKYTSQSGEILTLTSIAKSLEEATANLSDPAWIQGQLGMVQQYGTNTLGAMYVEEQGDWIQSGETPDTLAGAFAAQSVDTHEMTAETEYGGEEAAAIEQIADSLFEKMHDVYTALEIDAEGYGDQLANVALHMADSLPAFDFYVDAIVGHDVAMGASAQMMQLATEAAGGSSAAFEQLVQSLIAQGMSAQEASAAATQMTSVLYAQGAAADSASGAISSFGESMQGAANAAGNAMNTISGYVADSEAYYSSMVSTGVTEGNAQGAIYDYHAPGGIMTQPTVFHIGGERGPEAIAPLHAGPDTLKIMHEDIKANNQTQVIHNHFYVNGKEISTQIMPQVDEHIASRERRNVTGRAVR